MTVDGLGYQAAPRCGGASELGQQQTTEHYELLAKYRQGGRIIAIDSRWQGRPKPIHLLYRERSNLPRRTQLLRDYLLEHDPQADLGTVRRSPYPIEGKKAGDVAVATDYNRGCFSYPQEPSSCSVTLCSGPTISSSPNNFTMPFWGALAMIPVCWIPRDATFTLLLTASLPLPNPSMASLTQRVN